MKMKNNTIRFLLRIIPICCIISCTERIDIRTDDAPPRMVINGAITTDAKQHSIRITRSTGYFSTDKPAVISRATVTITDSDGKVIPLAENETEAGLYQTAKNVRGEEGKTYTLDVYLDDEHYQAKAHLNHSIQVDSISLQQSPVFRNRSIVEVLLYAQDIPGENYYSIFVAINDSVLNNTINRYSVMSNTMFKGDYVDGVAIYYLNQEPHDNDRDHREVLHIGDKVTLIVHTISKEYAGFISQVQTELHGSVPIFGGPPANVTTNIRCIQPKEGRPVSGFFTAFPTRSAEVIVEEDYKTKKQY